MKLANRIWEILYPVLLYYATISMGIMVAQMIFGSGNENYIICKIIGSIAALMVVYQDYKTDRMMWGGFQKGIPFQLDTLWNLLIIAGITFCLSVALNNLLSMSPLA